MPGQPRQAGAERGVALILVLLVIAIVAILATEVSSRVQLDIQKSRNRDQYQQAYWYALGGEQIARQRLQQSLGRAAQAHLKQAWAQPLRYPIEGGRVEIRVRDLQACLNINQLNNLSTESLGTDQVLLLRQLAALIGKRVANPDDALGLLEALRDWFDADLVPTGLGGAEDLYYSAQSPPYLSASAPITELSELRLVTGISTSRLDALAPFLCALPVTQSTINVNTLTPKQAPLLSALFEQALTDEDAEALIESRPADGYRTVDAFWKALPIADALKPQGVKEQLSIRSQFFLASITVSYYDARFSLDSRLRVKENRVLPYARRYGERR